MKLIIMWLIKLADIPMVGHHACGARRLYPSGMYNFDRLYSDARDYVGEGTFCYLLLVIFMFLMPQ